MAGYEALSRHYTKLYRNVMSWKLCARKYDTPVNIRVGCKEEGRRGKERAYSILLTEIVAELFFIKNMHPR